MSYSIGIDLGTTYSAAAVARKGEVTIVRLGNDRAAIPSVVLVRDDRSLLTGETASRRAIMEPQRVGREFKRRLGDPTPILIGGSPYSAESLMARLLVSILDQVRERQGGDPDHIAVSHPANWGPFKTDLLRQALQMAGVTRASMLTEPQAAAISYANDERLEPGEIIAVYDLGGGTFDTAVLRKTEDGFEILGTPVGIERLGGMDFDAAVMDHVRRALGDTFTNLDVEDPQTMAAVARLRDECTSARETLSGDTDVAIPVALPSGIYEVRLTRSELEAMIRPALEDTVVALRQALDSADVQAEDLHAVLLVGGASRTPLVAQMVSADLGRPVAVDADPKHAIAIGAAHHAASGVEEFTQGPESEESDKIAGSEAPADEPLEAAAAGSESPADEPLEAAAAGSEAPSDEPLEVAAASVSEVSAEVPPTPTPTSFTPSEGGARGRPRADRTRLFLVAGAATVAIIGGVFIVTQLGGDSTDPDSAAPAVASSSTTTPTTQPSSGSVVTSPTTTILPVAELVRASVDAGSMMAIDRNRPIIGTDLQATLTPPEYAPLRQLDDQVVAFVDRDNTSNQQYYDFATFSSTLEADPNAVWARLAPASWQALSAGVPDTFESLGLPPRDPVAGVPFDAADEYCTYATKRLPTEVEWELAAREGTIDITTVQNWVTSPEEYGDVPEGAHVLRGSFGIENLSVFFRTIGDTPTNRQNAGIRCAADDIIEYESPSGVLLYAREFSGADEAHDWPDLHDPNTPAVAFGYHAPDVFHIEVRSPLGVAVVSGVEQPANTMVSADFELRVPEEPVGGFRYGLIANANDDGYLTFTIEDLIASDGARSLRWCVNQSSEALVKPGVVVGFTAEAPSGACELDGVVAVEGIRNVLSIAFANGEAQFSIGNTLVATTPVIFQPSATFGFIVENTEPGVVSHVHFDNLAVVSI